MDEPSPQEIADAGFSEPDAKPVTRPAKKVAKSMHREFPQAPDAEKGILASIVLSPEDSLDICAEKGVTAGSFYLPANAELYAAFVEIRDSKRPVEFITIAQHLREKGKLEAVGGAATINELFVHLPSAANIKFYIEDLITAQTQRRIISVTHKFQAKAYETLSMTDAETALAEFEREVLAIRSGDSLDQDRSIKDAASAAIANIQHRFDNAGSISGLSWGLRSVDLATDGLVRGEFIVLSGLPGCGKTSLLRQAVRHIAQTVGPVAVWNLEMTDAQLAEAWIYTIAEINPVELRSRQPTDGECKRILDAAKELAKLPIILKGRPGMSVQDFQASVRRMKNRKSIVLAVVDSATQVGSDNPDARKRFEDVNDLGPGFKAAAKDNDIPVVVLWHLGSKFEERLTKDPEAMPIYSDLEGGAAGSRNCDKFCALVKRADRHEFCLPKQRMGEAGRCVPLSFEGKYTRFTEPAEEHTQEELIK